MKSTGAKLAEYRARSGLSLEKVAEIAGYKGRSSVQRYFEDAFDKMLDYERAVKFADAFEGRGDPPITRAEIMALTGLGLGSEVALSEALAPRYQDLPKDVPVYGSALGTYQDGVNEVIEQTIVHQGEPIDYFMRPPAASARKGLYGVYIAGSSQSPRFEEGEIAFCDPTRPPSIGDDVVVYLRQENGDDGERLAAVLIKRLVRRTAVYVELQQFNPPVTFKVETGRISSMHVVLRNKEMLAIQ